MNEAEARERCRKQGTAQCAAICLSHTATFTRDGQCPHAVEVWNRWETAARKSEGRTRVRPLAVQ
jgi:hypothetical protein